MTFKSGPDSACKDGIIRLLRDQVCRMIDGKFDIDLFEGYWSAEDQEMKLSIFVMGHWFYLISSFDDLDTWEYQKDPVNSPFFNLSRMIANNLNGRDRV